MRILLSQNLYSMISSRDEGRVTLHKWHVVTASCNVYAATWIRENGLRKKVYLHRFIMDVSNGDQVHHKDGDTLNNRRSNLEVCSQQTNLWYSRKGGT